MTDRELIEAVATQLGWTNLVYRNGRWFGKSPRFKPGDEYCPLPLWLTSLDASQAVVDTLADGHQAFWIVELNKIVESTWGRYNASPKQRIEAYLQVVGSEGKE